MSSLTALVTRGNWTYMHISVNTMSYHELQPQTNNTSHTIVMVSPTPALSGSGQGNCLDLLWTSEDKLGPQEFNV